MKNKYKLTLFLYKYFVDKVDPDIIISYIYNNVYELQKEMKYIPHTGDFDEFHQHLTSIYSLYYKEVIEPRNENWLYYLFPDPKISYYTWRYFSFKKFYIGLTCRIMFWSNINYHYNDPINWTIGYDFQANSEKVYIFNCQFILLENYNEFEIDESIGQEQIATYRYVGYKKGNKYPGQRVKLLEEVGKYEVSQKYKQDENIITLLEYVKKSFYMHTNTKLIEVLREVSKNRQSDAYKRVRPLWGLESELNEKVKPTVLEKQAKEEEEYLKKVKKS